jgi:hypothetical protein
VSAVLESYTAGQWQRGTGSYPYELVIVDNTLAPDVQVTGDVKPLPGSGAGT